MEKVVIFLIFLCPLIFFHELGHYLFARFFGVRVEVFSIGFGPKLLKFYRGSTQYALSLIPLGGYIKMFGDDPFNKDDIPAEEQHCSFNHQGKWARFWIVMGGPLANFVLAWVIFFGLCLVGEKMPEIKIGRVAQGDIFYAKGLRGGDVIKKINGVAIASITDLPLGGDDKVDSVTVSRFSGQTRLSLGVTAKEFIEQLQKHPPILRRPIVVGKKGERYAVSLEKTGVDWETSLDEIGYYAGDKRIFFFKAMDSGSGYTVSKVPTFSLSKKDKLFDFLTEHQLRVLELAIKNVRKGGPADKAGIRAGDTVVAFNGQPILSFDHLKERLKNARQPEVKISVWRKGETKTFNISPVQDEINGKKVKIIGVMSAGEYIRPKLVESGPRDLFSAFGMAFSRTGSAIGKVAESLKKLVTREIPLNQIGGPFRIGQVASDSFKTSVSYFFQLMALISANLGLLNLLPIPVLDGGHIMFICLEALNRGTLSRRKMEIAQQIGLSILLLLMAGALFNDFSWMLSN